MEVKAREIRLINPNRVKPHPKNNNIHPKEQKEELKKQIAYQGFRNPLVISNLSGYLVVGHLRLEIALELGMTEVPVIYQDFTDEAQEYSYLTADNAVAMWAELDYKAINEELLNLGKDFRVDLLGIKDFRAFEEKGIKDDDLYTKKVEAPIYEPKEAEQPKINTLLDLNKTNALLEEIRTSSIDREVKAFLEHAAMRHTVFDYGKIAEYYAHAPKEVQELMEKSALVIIDFDKAIENGFVELSEKIAKEYLND